jgi:hypothetical protein
MLGINCNEHFLNTIGQSNAPPLFITAAIIETTASSLGHNTELHNFTGSRQFNYVHLKKNGLTASFL